MSAGNTPTASVVSAGRPVRVTVWGENRVEQTDPDVRAVYPDGMHETIAGAIRDQLGDRVEVRTATLDEPDHGLDGGRLETTDVLTWWGHLFHDDVADRVAAAVQQRVLDGMGLIVLHSGHLSKPFTRLMGTSCNLRWREADDRELVWTVNPAHPIAQNVPPVFAIDRAGDVRRVLRHPGARRARVHQLVHGRRGVPQRLLLPAWKGTDLLLRPGPRDISRSTTTPTYSGSSRTPCCGLASSSRRRWTRRHASSRPTGWFEKQA